MPGLKNNMKLCLKAFGVVGAFAPCVLQLHNIDFGLCRIIVISIKQIVSMTVMINKLLPKPI